MSSGEFQCRRRQCASELQAVALEAKRLGMWLLKSFWVHVRRLWVGWAQLKAMVDETSFVEAGSRERCRALSA